MNIGLKDLYQLLIAELRYGFTRNNHLMPDGAFAHTKHYIDGMWREDQSYAIRTLSQAVEETISEFVLRMPFNSSEGFSNELQNSYINFIVWGLDRLVYWTDVWTMRKYVYNLDSFTRTLKEYDKLDYIHTLPVYCDYLFEEQK